MFGGQFINDIIEPNYVLNFQTVALLGIILLVTVNEVKNFQQRERALNRQKIEEKGKVVLIGLAGGAR
jgi:uncharacterized protein YggL (DUF469 family)